MKTLLLSILAICFVAIELKAAQRVRRVPIQTDQIATVRTSLGIATIIQVPDRPTSVVVGDQNSFKVEYLDQAITIKPTVGGAKSNLYIYTDWKRFNVELISGPESVADYVVYLDIPKDKPQKIRSSKDAGVKWTEFKNQVRNENLTFTVTRLGRTSDRILLIDFTISSTKKEIFRPDCIWLTQSGKTRPIHNLFLSSVEVSPKKPIPGVLQMREIDINTNEPFKLELRRAKNSYLTIHKLAGWVTGQQIGEEAPTRVCYVWVRRCGFKVEIPSLAHFFLTNLKSII